MNKNSFKKIIILIMSILFAYGLVGILLINNNCYYTCWKDLMPVFLAVPVGILTFSFQRRMSYIQALRDLWKQLLPTIQGAIQYTHLSNPEQSDFAKVQTDLSTSIDLIRAIFKNYNGLYPYDNLKDILAIISWLGYEKNVKDKKKIEQARKCIVRLWQEMYLAMLEEFDNDVPIIPVGKYLHEGSSIADYLIKDKFDDKLLLKNVKPSACTRL